MDTLLAPIEDIAPWDYNAPLDPIDHVNASPLTGLTHPIRRARFIHALHNGHTVRWACAYAGLDYSDTYRLKKKLTSFSEAWEAAQAGPGGDVWEDLLLSKAESDNPASVTAVIVGLKMHKRFVENAPGGTGAPVQVQVINVILPPGAPVPASLPVSRSVDLLPPPSG